MSEYDFTNEVPDNPEEKCCLSLVLDTSGSMSGAPINALNTAIQSFESDIEHNELLSARLEVGIVTFDSNVEIVRQPGPIDAGPFPTLTTKGSTKMVDGIREGIQMVEARKQWYKDCGLSHFRPWVVMITDGYPNSDQDVDAIEKEIAQQEGGRHLMFMPIGVKGADFSLLERIANTAKPAMIDGLKFEAFFDWLSKSMEAVTAANPGDAVDMPDTSDWMKGMTV